MGGSRGDEYFNGGREESEGGEEAEEGVWRGMTRVSLVTRCPFRRQYPNPEALQENLKERSTAKI